MSYTTQDRYNVPLHSYNASPAKPASTGCGKTWWPDYGPTIRDFSFQENCEPTSYHFKNPRRGPGSDPPSSDLQHMSSPAPTMPALRQFRKQAPPGSDPESRRRWAKEATAKQSNLNMLAKRAKVIDSWMSPPDKSGDDESVSSVGSRSLPKIRSEGTLRVLRPSSDFVESQPLPTIDPATLRLPGRGLLGDKLPGMRSAVELSSRPTLSESKEIVRKQSMEVRFYGSPSRRTTLPQNRYVLDPATCLPVPRVVAHLGPRNQRPKRKESAMSPEDLAVLEMALSF